MSNNQSVKVWDIGVRLFHWSLVAFFVVAYFTAEEENILHIYAGYAVLGLLIFRLIWGFIGGQYARFSDFIYSPGHVLKYARSLVTGQPQHYLGHNPLGGWMIVVLLVGLTVVTVTGLKVYALEEGRGPLAGAEDRSIVSSAYAEEDENEGDEQEGKGHDEGKSAGEEFWEELHEVSTNITLGLVALHILGVVLSSRLHGENLVKAMITGKKELKS